MKHASLGTILTLVLSVVMSLLLISLLNEGAVHLDYAFDAFDNDETFQRFLGELKSLGLAILFTLLGIVFKISLDKLQGNEGRGVVRDLISGALLTPLVLAGTFESLQAMQGFILPSLFCFQNGFFWVTLLRSEMS